MPNASPEEWNAPGEVEVDVLGPPSGEPKAPGPDVEAANGDCMVEGYAVS